jgi:AraC-like DNA-binding protein
MEKENSTSPGNLLRFLIELATGQWNATLEQHNKGEKERVQGEGQTSTSESLLALLLSDELRSLILHKAYVNPHKKYGFVQHGMFLLDGDLLIRGMTGSAASFLGFSSVALYRSDFTTLLNASSKKEFYGAVDYENDMRFTDTQLLMLTFINKDGVSLRADCFVASLQYGKQRLAVSLYTLGPIPALLRKIKIDNRHRQGVDVQKVYDFILAHRDGIFPSTHTLARQFGTNEFELKRDFKKRFGTSIYQCYMHERLKRAYALIIESTLSLSEIARLSGFEDYSAFARAFRKQYGVNPAKARESSK